MIVPLMPHTLIKPEWEAWDRLRGFGNSRLVQATIIMPIIGYVILFNEELASYFKLFVDSEAAPAIPWRLYFLYFGFCFLSVGSIIFAIKCPHEVKHHGNAYTFIANELTIMQPVRKTGMKETLLVAFYQHTFPDCQYDFVTAADVGSETNDSELAAIRRTMQSAKDEYDSWNLERIMLAYFEVLEEKYPQWRRTTFLCYAVGIVLLAVPTAQTFFLVLVSLGKSILGP